MKLAPRLLVSLLPLLCSCEKKEASDGVPVYGEPVGIQMEVLSDDPAKQPKSGQGGSRRPAT
jgi:hypothetical protein